MKVKAKKRGDKLVIKIKEKNKGKLSKELGVPEDKNIPAKKLAIKPSDDEATRKRKQFAINSRKWGK